MTDLHTHILPGMDDGARDRSEALKLVGMENKSGVTQIVCTPVSYTHLDVYKRQSSMRRAAISGRSEIPLP